MQHNHTIVSQLARLEVVERLVANVCHRPASELGDLVQMVYDILLHKPPQELQRAERNRALNYYIVAIIKNLYFSKTSPYHRKIRRPGQHDEVPQKWEPAPDADESDERCRRAVATLPPEERNLFLRYVEAGGLRNLSRSLGVSVSTLHYRIEKIRQTLKKKITNN